MNDSAMADIRPLMTARPPGAKAMNDRILCATPNIEWNRVRGRKPEREKADCSRFRGRDAGAAPNFNGKPQEHLRYTRVIERAARARASEGDGR